MIFDPKKCIQNFRSKICGFVRNLLVFGGIFRDFQFRAFCGTGVTENFSTKLTLPTKSAKYTKPPIPLIPPHAALKGMKRFIAQPTVQARMPGMRSKPLPTIGSATSPRIFRMRKTRVNDHRGGKVASVLTFAGVACR